MKYTLNGVEGTIGSRYVYHDIGDSDKRKAVMEYFFFPTDEERAKGRATVKLTKEQFDTYSGESLRSLAARIPSKLNKLPRWPISYIINPLRIRDEPPE